MEDRFRIGVLGAGQIAQAAHFPACRKSPQVELYAICDVADDLRERMGAADALARRGAEIAVVLDQAVEQAQPCAERSLRRAFLLQAQFAEHALVAVLRMELAGEPLRVVEVAPGMVATEEFSLNRFGGDRARADAVYAEVEAPLTADDVAETIVHAVELPAHVNLDLVTVKPVAQGLGSQTVKGPLRVKR